jgi:hypothetical protein
MGSKRFLSLNDFVRHGMNIHLECRNGHCTHHGIVDAWSACQWFRLHRWGTGLDSFMGSSALDRFRCTKCGAKAGSASPSEAAVTVLDFFPADDRGWKMALRRLQDVRQRRQERIMDEDEYERTVLEMQDRIAMMSDLELRAAYDASDAGAGDPWQDALAQALKDRDIDF